MGSPRRTLPTNSWRVRIDVLTNNPGVVDDLKHLIDTLGEQAASMDEKFTAEVATTATYVYTVETVQEPF